MVCHSKSIAVVRFCSFQGGQYVLQHALLLLARPFDRLSINSSHRKRRGHGPPYLSSREKLSIKETGADVSTKKICEQAMMVGPQQNQCLRWIPQCSSEDAVRISSQKFWRSQIVLIDALLSVKADVVHSVGYSSEILIFSSFIAAQLFQRRFHSDFQSRSISRGLQGSISIVFALVFF